MRRYIDANRLYNRVKSECNPYGKPTIDFESGCRVLSMIEEASEVDEVGELRAKVMKKLERVRDAKVRKNMEWVRKGGPMGRREKGYEEALLAVLNMIHEIESRRE